MRITRAPMSAKTMAAKGPGPMPANSNTFTLVKVPGISNPSFLRQRHRRLRQIKHSGHRHFSFPPVGLSFVPKSTWTNTPHRDWPHDTRTIRKLRRQKGTDPAQGCSPLCTKGLRAEHHDGCGQGMQRFQIAPLPLLPSQGRPVVRDRERAHLAAAGAFVIGPSFFVFLIGAV